MNYANFSDDALDRFVDSLMKAKAEIHKVGTEHGTRFLDVHRDINTKLIAAEKERLSRGRKPVPKIKKLAEDEVWRTRKTLRDVARS